MTTTTSDPGAVRQDAPTSSARERRRVVFATVVGTTVEWYDFFIFAYISAILFGELFFAGFGANNSALAFLTMGLSFLFRPFGAFVAGHLGDRFGRRIVLTATLILMGVATMLIGALPTFQSPAGWAAPIMLVLLRILQGISAGGEWGGAVLLAVEHAPTAKRGIYGASPQIGVPIGLILASLMVAIMQSVTNDAEWKSWGWRVPFFFSAVLIVVGYFVRRAVEESPVFAELAERRSKAQAPVLQLFRKHFGLVLVAALVFAGNNAVGYMTTGGFVQRFSTRPEYGIGLPQQQVAWAVLASGVVWLIFTWLGGFICDKIGRRTTYIIGWICLGIGAVALFPLVTMGTIEALTAGLVILAVGLGLTYGPQSALYAELFPASIRFSGVSISYAIGSILGGAFAPTIADTLWKTTNGTTAITAYLVFMVLVGLTATLLLRDRQGIPLGQDHEEQQAQSPLVFHR